MAVLIGRKEGGGMMRRKKLSIAERQKRLNRICKIAEYVVPIVVSAVAATIFTVILRG